MKRLYIFMCLIGCIMVSRAQSSMTMLSLTHIGDKQIQQNVPIQNDTVITLDYPHNITGLYVSGTAILNHSSNSLVRITLQDDYNTEWLVYELFPLLADSNTVSFSNAAFETSVLDNIKAKRLKVKIINAVLQLTDINTSNQAIASYSLQQSRAMEAQSNYIINKLNENLEKRNIPWRAGETSVSQMTYEEKKAMFGGEVPNLGGFEYYKGGIFVMPDYELQTEDKGIATTSTASTSKEGDPYVKEWDWRNRHGKNWMTSVKFQGGCGSCWAFATLGTLEAYINLYYNQLLDIDLSEQELISCAVTSDGNEGNTVGKGCNGGNFQFATDYIRDFGIIDENAFPYIAGNGECSNKSSNPSEQFFITATTWDILWYPQEMNEIKSNLFNAPLSMTIHDWNHDVVLTGFKVFQEGDVISYSSYSTDTIKAEDPLIGQTALLIKNSYGDWWGEEGYGYIILGDSSTITLNGFSGPITSMNHDNNDIVSMDYDGDGYYFAGINTVPGFIPRYPGGIDNDDSNDDYALIDSYGNLQRIIPSNLNINNYTVSTQYFPYNDYRGFIPYNLTIKSGGNFIVKENFKFYKDATVTIEAGGKMTIDGCTLEQADITVKPGGELTLINNGHIILKKGDDMNAEKGSIVNINNGCSIDIGN